MSLTFQVASAKIGDAVKFTVSDDHQSSSFIVSNAEYAVSSGTVDDLIWERIRRAVVRIKT